MKRAVIFSAIALAISGCASTSPISAPNIIIDNDDSALQELKEISIEARHELRILAKAKEAQAQKSMSPQQHKQRFFQATHIPDGFEKKKTFHYTGKASEAAKAIAMLAGYKIEILGKKIPSEPWVTINMDNKPLNEALKELGMQTGELIRVEVHDQANPKLMRFIYK